VAHERVLARPGLGVPHAYARVQGSTHHMDSIKLQTNIKHVKNTGSIHRQLTEQLIQKLGVKNPWPAFLARIRELRSTTTENQKGMDGRRSWRYLERVDAIGVSLERVEAFLAFRIPHFDRVVVGTTYYQTAVVLDASDGRHVADQHVQTLASFHVPHPECGVA